MRDAFDVLGVAPRFDIDYAELDRLQCQLLADLHPNRILETDAQGETGVLFARQGEINEACRQLRDPLIRAEMLLQRRNEPFSGLRSSMLLSRIFEQREAIERAITQGDSTKLSEFVGAALCRQAELVGILEVYFSTNPAPEVQQQPSIASVLEELRYLDKMVKRGEQALDDFQ